MADLVCSKCRSTREVTVHHRGASIRYKPDSIRGVLTCQTCAGKTPFGLQDSAINFYPGEDSYGAFHNPPDLVQEMFVDAEMCWFGGGMRGAVAMARATLEEALERKGYKGRLEDQIDAARGKDLDDRHYMLAHGSRLAGNDALHKEQNLSPSLIPTALAAVVQIVNHLYP